MAQAADTPATSAQALEEVTVTGSRIRRAVPDTVQPIDIVAGQSILDRGLANVADAVNELPGVGVPTGPVGGQGGQTVGRNFVNLFNLGSQRTLVLVNGRRFVSGNPPAPPVSSDQGEQANVVGGGDQVDLNNIPVGLIDRVETVQAGGAAVYGSDAVAGVVNIILKKNFQGFEVDGQYGNTTVHDFPTHSGRITAGINFADGRGNIAGNFEVSGTGSLVERDRAFSAAGLSTVANPNFGEPGEPARIYIPDHSFDEFTSGGVPFLLPVPVPIPSPRCTTTPGVPMFCMAKQNGQPLRFDTNGNLVPYDLGTYYQPAFASGGDGYRIADVTSLVTSIDRQVFTGLGHFDLTDHVKLSGEVLASSIDAKAPANQGIFNTDLLGEPNNSIMFTLANPFLSDQARGILAAQGAGAFWLSRASLDLVPDNSAVRSTQKTQRGLVSLDGDFDVGERNFYWNTSYGYGHVEGRFTSNGINQQRFLYAVDAVRDPSGQIVCNVKLTNPGSTDPDIQACQPVNLFGAGAPSEAAREYLGLTFGSDFTSHQSDFVANFGGDLFKLPTGSLSFTTGVEYRRETADFTPNAASAAGLGRDIPVVGQSGKYDTKEIYAEVLVPIVGGDFTLPGVHALELDASGRRVDHSLAGNNNAWSAGLRWSVIPDLSLRATRSSTFRSPSLTELFLPASSAQQGGIDPCDRRNITSGPNAGVRQANCQALFTELGLPANFQLTSIAQNATITVINSGNPDLVNETAQSWSFGLSYVPHYVPGLEFRFDHVRIDLKNAISSFDLTSILSTCYDDPSYPVADVCGRFVRDGQAQLTGATTGYINAGFRNFRGDSFDIDYQLPESRLGRVRVSLGAFHLRELEESISGLGFDFDPIAGEVNTPEWSGRATLDYSFRDFGAVWTTRYVGSAVFDKTNTAATVDILGVPHYTKHDVVLRYRLFDKYTVRAGVTNLTNEFPPYPISYANSGVYDVIGRSWFLGLNAKF
jgi:outer membrane receptor protein involved in Fe transport